MWGSKTTTTRLRAENINGTSYQYVYDSLGNITEIKNGSGKALNTYTYDKMSQLISEVDHVRNKQIDYTYDTSGNILSETISDIDADGNTVGTPVVHSYAYENSEWKDKLTAYDGQEITYDKIGNPLTYRDGMTMTWKNGRQLATLQNAEHNISYSYDSGSVRVSKNVDGAESKYAYINGLLVYEIRGGMRFYYCYDASGMLYSVNFTRYDGAGISTYYFSHNSRGDIIGIYDGSGTLQAKYEYDAWGNVLSITDANGNAITSATHIGNLNPFRYRGYYYDSESGLYYLMSRYYDPATHRFINADGYFQAGGDILDVNMSAYCGNNPINRSDTTGEKWTDLKEMIDDFVDAVLTILAQLFGSKSASSPAAPSYKSYAKIEKPDTSKMKYYYDNYPNCYSYAIGENSRSCQPGEFSGATYTTSVESVFRAVNIDMFEKNRSCRMLESYDSPILSFEYRVAVRVNENVWDYHFMVQTDTGQWAEKHGPCGASKLYGIDSNPSNILWTNGQTENERYTSKIIYFALSK